MSTELATTPDVNRAYAPVVQHAFVCHECGYGQLGDRGCPLPREAFPSAAAYEAAKKAAFDAGRGWDGKTFVLAPLGAADVPCPCEANHGDAVKLTEVDQLRTELAELKQQFADVAAGKNADSASPRALAAAPAPPIADLATKLARYNAPAV